MTVDRVAEAVKNVVTSVVTLFGAVQTALVVFADEIVRALPGVEFATDAQRITLIVAGGLAAAIAALRRVTPVPPEQRGVV
jgi:hypothetical protein